MGVEGTRFLEGHLVITPLGFVPIRLASSCASLFRSSLPSSVTVTRLLFASRPLGFRFSRRSGHDIFHTHCALSVRLSSPLFFPMRIPTSSIFPNPALPPRPPTLAPPSVGISNPPFHSSIPPVTLSYALSLPLPLHLSPIVHLSFFWNPQSLSSISGTGDPPTT